MTRGKQSFLGGAALLTVTMLVTKAIGALYKIPLGNLLDEQGMNYFYAAYNIYNLLLMVSTAGLPLALSRLVSQAEALGWVNRRRRIVSVAFWLFLLLGLLSSGLMFFLAGDLAGWMHNTRAEDAIRVLSPAVLCVCLVSVIRGYTQGMGDMRPTAASEVIESASKLMVGLGLAWWLLRQGDPSHIAAGAIAGVTAGVILSLLALTVWTATHLSRDKGRDDPGQSRDILRQLLAIGVPITVGSVSLSVINLLDQSITMGILQTSWGLTEPEAAGLYGTYSYAGNLFALPAAFIYPLTISLIPAIGAALARGDRSAAGRHTAAAFHRNGGRQALLGAHGAEQQVTLVQGHLADIRSHRDAASQSLAVGDHCRDGGGARRLSCDKALVADRSHLGVAAHPLVDIEEGVVAVGQLELVGGVQVIVLQHKTQAGGIQRGLFSGCFFIFAGHGHLAGGTFAVVGDGGDDGSARIAARHLAVAIHRGNIGVAAHPDDEVIIALAAGVQVALGAGVIIGDLQLHLGQLQFQLGTGSGQACQHTGRGLRGQRGSQQGPAQSQQGQKPPRGLEFPFHWVELPSLFHPMGSKECRTHGKISRP